VRILRIAKKSGGERVIYAPSPEEAAVYRALLPRLHEVQSRLCRDAHGFVRGRSAVTGARLHAGRAHSACWDLRSFFDTVTREQILAAAPELVDIVDQLLIDGAPRQGLPTSPLASNIAAAPLDRAIQGWLAGRGVYTRYADDLTVSSDDHSVVEEALTVIPALVAAQGWEIHPAKTRVQHATGGARVICGVVVADDPRATRATRATRRKLRAAQHRAEHGANRGARERARAQARGLGEWCAQRTPVAQVIRERCGRDRGQPLADDLAVHERRERRAAVRDQLATLDIRAALQARGFLADHPEAGEKGAATRLAATFGARWRDWIASAEGQALHDLLYWLPTAGRADSGLADALFAWRRANSLPTGGALERIARCWERLTAEQRALGPAALARVTRGLGYPRVRHVGFAAESADAGCSAAEYRRHESRWLRALRAIDRESIPRVTVTAGGLTARVLDRDDPRGVWVGQHTACCQHPEGEASSSAWYAVEHHDSAILVVEHDGLIVAQSWLWRHEGVLVADNCEALGDWGGRCRQIYEIWAQATVGRLGVTEVRLGTRGDLYVDGLPRVPKAAAVPPPAGTYSDARQRQVVLAPRQKG